MSLTLQLQDNADGSGGVATLTGTTGASVSLFNSRFQGTMGTLAAVAAGSRVGDGTIVVAPGNGYYLWYAQTTSLFSNVVYQALTDGTQSVHYRCLLGTQAELLALSLSGMPGGNILVKWLPRHWERIDSTPQICIVPLGKEGQPGLLTGLDDIEYPVVIATIDKDNNDYTLNLALRTLWRQQIFRTFRHQRLPGVPEIITTPMVTEYVVDPALFNRNYFYSALLARFRSREVRGFGK